MQVTAAVHILKYLQEKRELYEKIWMGTLLSRSSKLDVNILKKKAESIFLELGFNNEIIGEKHYRYLVYNNCYCKITYLNSRKAFVIESADNAIDASNGVLEDGDLYYLNIPEEVMLRTLRKDIVAHYME